jgi:tRNA 5-methylaminomethyl-2-thiouridine biosynthesis bifunctional protein
MPNEERPSPIIWQGGLPVSARFGDVYYSREDGLAEAQAVFLAGCGLPDAWRGRRNFTVAELGFGTGLNIVALLDLWQQTRPPGGHLHFFSIEAHPVSSEDAARALAAFPQAAETANLLLQNWPGPARGFHRIELAGAGATFDLAVMDAAEALGQWRGRADAWFLDGFAPASNPQMWSEEVIGALAAHCAPGARVATFTVAGAVRRALSAAGFSVEKRPGHGRKRERLEAVYPGEPKDVDFPGRIAVIGGGIAAASLCRAFDAVGCAVSRFSGDERGASGNPAALVTPALDAGGGARAAFYAQAFARAAHLYHHVPQGVIARGVTQLEEDARDPSRFDRIAVQDIFAPGAIERLSPAEVARRLDEPKSVGGLLFRDGLVIEPAMVLEAWLTPRSGGPVARIEPGGGEWRLILQDGAAAGADVVIVAAGWDSAALWPQLPLSPVRGQASWVNNIGAVTPAAFSAYGIPTRDGVLFGATHQRADTGLDVRPADHLWNLAALAGRRPGLARRIEGGRIEGRAAIRAATRDRMPLAGQLAPGLYVLSGLGSRGFTTAPLLAEHVAAQVCSLPEPLAEALERLVAPDRL